MCMCILLIHPRLILYLSFLYMDMCCVLFFFYVLSTGFVYCKKLRAAAATTTTNGEPDKLQGTEFQPVLFVFIFLLSYDTRIYR